MKNIHTHTIIVEEFYFGHKGGMKPLAWSKTLTDHEKKILYQLVEAYQGSIFWGENKWAISWFFLSPYKAAITVIFPDADRTGRSTVFGHTLILKIEDFKTIKYNPFILQDSELFHHNQNIEGVLKPREITIDLTDESDSCDVHLYQSPKNLKKLLSLAICGRKVCLGTTALPANRLLKTIVCCLPPALRAGFTFSTLEIDLPEFLTENSDSNQHVKDIQLRVVSIQYAKTYANNNVLPVYLFDAVNDKLIESPFVEKKDIQSAGLLANSILEIISKGENLSQIFETIGLNQNNLDPHQYWVLLCLLRQPENIELSAHDLDCVKESALKHKTIKNVFVKRSINRLLSEKGRSERKTLYFIIEHIIQKEPVKHIWKELCPAFKVLINQYHDFSIFLIKRAQKSFPEQYFHQFTNDLFPIILQQIMASHVSSDENKNVTNIVSMLLDQRWINHPDVIQITQNYFIHAEKIEWKTISPIILMPLIKYLSSVQFVDLIQNIINGVPKKSQLTEQLIYHVAFQLIDASQLEDKWEKLSKLLIDVFFKPQAIKQFQTIIQRYINISFYSGQECLIQSLRHVSQKKFISYKNIVLKTLKNLPLNEFETAITLLHYFDFTCSFDYVNSVKQLFPEDRGLFFSYLSEAAKHSQSKKIKKNKQFISWVEKLIDKSFITNLTQNEMESLYFFRIKVDDMHLQLNEKQSFGKKILKNSLFIIFGLILACIAIILFGDFFHNMMINLL